MRLRAPGNVVFVVVMMCACAQYAVAQTSITIPAEALKDALEEYISVSDVQLIYSIKDVSGKRSHAVRGMSVEDALPALLRGTGLVISQDDRGALIVSQVLPAEGQPAFTETVIVTGSRIPGNDDFAPPVTAMSFGELEAATPSNIPDALNKLPMFAPAQTSNSATSGANGRGYRPSGNFLDLRGLGPNRTLVLQDGKRVPATFYDGTVDINTLPQLLIQRVEVVTGGASAVYGSDAVTGVVNFIIDKSLNGIKAIAQGGISNYGDAKSFRLGAAGGSDVFENGHLLWSIEYYDRAAITDQGARPYGNLATSVVGNGTPATPYSLIYNARRSVGSFGGLVTSGPFAGLQFGLDGSLVPFDPGIATATSGISIGGDGGFQHNEYLLPALTTLQTFGRFDYAVAPGLSAYIQASYATSRSYEANQAITNNPHNYPITIYSGNAFLKPEQQAVLDETGTQYFTLNRVDDELSRRLSLRYHIASQSITAGTEGNLFRTFKWDAYYTRGDSATILATPGNINSQRFYAAIDAVRDRSTGNIVCRVSLIAPGSYPGCVPFNLFGGQSPSQAAIQYVEGLTSWTARNVLNDFGANLTGTLAQGPGGPIKIALGGEYRSEGLDLSTTAPNLTFNSDYLRVGGPAGTTVPPDNLKWIKETQSPTKGSGFVYEGDVELSLPLLHDMTLARKLAIDGAYRYTNYSTSGQADTWKVSVVWDPVDTLQLRASRSRDIRAPTLYDLYEQPLTTNSGLNDTLTSASGTVNTIQTGNPRLVPEVAFNSSAGAVYQPGWLSDFRLSIDYFHIGLDNAIAMIQGSAPVVQNACLASGGVSPLCNLIVRPFSNTNTSPANFPTLLYAVKLNIARTYSEGFDLEADYSSALLPDLLGVNGVVNFRLFWTHQPIFKTQALPGSLITDAAGTARTPTDRIAMSARYQSGRFRLDIMQRVDSSFRQSSNATLIYNIPDVRAYFQTDLSVAYDFGADGQQMTAFLAIDNLFNEQGGLYQVPGYTGSPGMNYPVGPRADLIGRYFTLGVRFGGW